MKEMSRIKIKNLIYKIIILIIIKIFNKKLKNLIKVAVIDRINNKLIKINIINKTYKIKKLKIKNNNKKSVRIKIHYQFTIIPNLDIQKKISNKMKIKRCDRNISKTNIHNKYHIKIYKNNN